jgi:hypothetical protein
MTNIESADETVAKIRNAGWWQGSVVDEATLRGVEPTLPGGHDYWVMATQTCNLYNKDFAKISKVEWVAAKRVLDSVPAQKGGRNPRLLEVKASSQEGEVWLVCNSQERHWGHRANIAKIAPTMAFINAKGQGQAENHKDNFATWLARGYTRLELSDELNQALADGKLMAAIDKLVAAHDADLFGIFIRVADEQKSLPEHVKPPCEVDLRIVVSQESNLEKVRKKLEDLFAKASVDVGPGKPKLSRETVLANDHGIILDQQAIPASRWTATMIEQHTRFNFKDYLSGPDGDDLE